MTEGELQAATPERLELEDRVRRMPEMVRNDVVEYFRRCGLPDPDGIVSDLERVAHEPVRFDVFLSYSRADSSVLASRLADRLPAGVPDAWQDISFGKSVRCELYKWPDGE